MPRKLSTNATPAKAPTAIPLMVPGFSFRGELVVVPSAALSELEGALFTVTMLVRSAIELAELDDKLGSVQLSKL